ncbi:MAG TPA: sn-glycerol-3-phosphate ABC transporter ATP-binding protein UgpC [Methylomirabilota bacterium]|nr:sn-glycerol-3-phosphate ABC transporter ATP-binding protein UgpC [Methylomirabilota bacterium]
MARVTLSEIDKSYGTVTVIKDLALEIEDKEFVVLVGPSGCGKTTTLRMVAGLESVTGGTVRIGEREVTHLRPGLRNCAMVFQNYALYPHMTVRDNIGYGMRVRRVPEAERAKAIDNAARILGLEPYLDRKPRNLSGGQRQRVAIGRAIVRDPDVFLFDEPLSNLDAKLRIEMRAEIKSLHNRLKTTIIYVTHDQVEAMTLADRVVVMNAGKIEQAADPITLYEKPANRFVAGFIGAPSMNFIDARLTAVDGGVAVALSDGSLHTVPADRSTPFLAHVGKPVVLGIRPENTGQALDGVGARLTVANVEPLGPHTLAIGSMAGAPATVQLEAHARPPIGGEVAVAFDMTKMHLFEPDTGMAIR